jgi:hypothetical protein
MVSRGGIAMPVPQLVHNVDANGAEITTPIAVADAVVESAVKVNASTVSNGFVAIGGTDGAANYRARTTLYGHQVTLNGAAPDDTWSFSTATPLTDANDIVIFTAVAGKRNYIKSIQYLNRADKTGEIKLRENADTIWRMYAPPLMTLPASIVFDPPIRTNSNRNVRIACSTADLNVHVAVQGYTVAL